MFFYFQLYNKFALVAAKEREDVEVDNMDIVVFVVLYRREF